MNKVYSVEKGFLSKLLETKDMQTIKDLQIKERFLTGDNRRVFKFILDSYREDGEIPTERVIHQKFPNVHFEKYEVDGREVIGTEESFRYWCKELRGKAKHNQIAEFTEEIAEKLNKGDAEEAYALMKKGVWQIEDEIIETEAVDITKDTSDRKEAYLKRKETKGMIGIPTGIDHLDNIMHGLVKETLTTVIARTGVGKTFFLVLLAAHAMLDNYRVLLFVTEMSTELMQDRIEAMLYGMMYGDFNYSRFKSGTLDRETESNYFDFLENDLPNLEPLVLETVQGVSSVVSAIEREHPDLVLIDSAYLMEDEQGAKDDWLRFTHITRDLKKVAKKWHIPIVINSQADKKSNAKSGPALKDISYAQSAGMDSDNVLALYRDEVMLLDNEMGIRVLKQREGVLGKAVINWDFTKMNFDSIYFESESNQDEESGEASENLIEVEE